MDTSNPIFSHVLLFSVVVIVIAGGALAYFFSRETKVQRQMDHDVHPANSNKGARPI
jgi:hypothetical protein